MRPRTPLTWRISGSRAATPVRRISGDQRCLLDTGPLVAFFIKRDQHHVWAVSQFKALTAPFATCEAVLAEADHILENSEPGAAEKLRAFLESGIVEISFSLSSQLPAVLKLQRRFADSPMALADACLVRMAELDERDLSSRPTVTSEFTGPVIARSFR